MINSFRFQVVNGILERYEGPKDLETLVLPEGITYIQPWALKDLRPSLTRVVLPKSMTRISDSAFRDFTRLRDVVNMESLKAVGNHAFENTGLRAVSLPNLEDLGVCAFSGCRDLESVELGGSLPSLPHRCFAFCFALKEFTVPEGVKRMDETVFDGTQLRSLRLPRSLLSIEWASSPFPKETRLLIHPENPVYYVEDGALRKRPYNQEGGLLTVLPSPTEVDRVRASTLDRADLRYGAEGRVLWVRRLLCPPEQMEAFARECRRLAYRVEVEHISGNDDYDIEEVDSREERLEEIPLSDVVISDGQVYGFRCEGQVLLKGDFNSVIQTRKHYEALSHSSYVVCRYTYRLWEKPAPGRDGKGA